MCEYKGALHFLSMPISMFVFDILQIPSGCIQIFNGRIVPTQTPSGYRPGLL
jgi:hypothetical protein